MFWLNILKKNGELLMQGLLRNKNVVLTGASRGIGRVMLGLFAQNGANIWACCRTKDEQFEAELSSIEQKHGVWLKPVYFDLAEDESIKVGVKEILQEKLPIDILINNAGVPYGGLFTMTPMSKLREIFQINYFAQIQIMQCVLKVMIRQKKGCIINMASIGGIETAPGYLAYGSSKAALIYATKSMSHEVGNYGIRVNAIAPGLVETKMGSYKSDEEIKKIIARSSLHRKADPMEIAQCALFLASDQSSFITGQVLIADGGRICV